MKTAGDPLDPGPSLPFTRRVELLRTAAVIASTIPHPVLAPYHGTIESAAGPMLVHDWVDAEQLGTDRHRPGSAFQRFRALPAAEILRALNQVYDLHARLTEAGWVVGDFYDGSLLYDFTRGRLTVIDLDQYRPGPYRNTMGRMFGSRRFMAPEEFEPGALIDQRTTAFVMARTAFVLLGDGGSERTAFRGNDAQYAVLTKASAAEPADRYSTYRAFHRDWLTALGPY